MTRPRKQATFPLVDVTKAFARRRKLSATIWVTLVICAGLTLLQVIFSPSFLLAGIALALGILGWSERRVCKLFAQNDPRGATLGFWNQIILGIIACAYLLRQSWSAPGMLSALSEEGLPGDMAASAVTLLQQAYFLATAVVAVSQIAIAIYYLRAPRVARVEPQPDL